MWIYSFSSENCKFCVEPKMRLEDFSEKHSKIPVIFKDNTDPLFKQFHLYKVPAMVVVESDGDIRKYEGRGSVCDEIDKLNIITKLNLTVEF